MRSRAAILAAATIATTIAAVLVPGSAQAAPATRGAGYVWASNPTSASYVPPANYQMNSTGALNSVTRQGVGRYTVRFAGLGVLGGVPHVTRYGSGAGTCKATAHNPLGEDQLVHVNCFSASGVLADAAFTASYTNRLVWRGFDYGATYPGAYLVADQPTAASYTPHHLYRFSTAGTAPTISRTGTGTYRVFLPGIGGAVTGGHAVVTGRGAAPGHCGAFSHGWNTPSTIQVLVRCFDAAGDPADSTFALTFTDRTNVLGLEGCCNPDGHQSAYVLAHNPTAAGYAPAASYLHSTGSGTATATRQGVGDYLMRLTGVDLTTGTVQVRASSWDAHHCTVAYWNTAGVKVRCYGPGGVPADIPYQLDYTGPWLLG